LDDIAVLTHFRSTASHRLFKGDQGVGSPSAPVNRRDKNVRTRLMTGIRLFVYLIDALSARSAVRGALRTGADLVIFDRYIYDELANLPVRNPFLRAYVRLVMALVPSFTLAISLMRIRHGLRAQTRVSSRVSAFQPAVLPGSERIGWWNHRYRLDAN